MDLNNFDATAVEPNSGFDPIPAGMYRAVITNSVEKPTKAGTGHYLEFTFQVIEGEFNKRQLWARLNLDNPNPKAVQIAKGDLSAICRAVNELKPADSGQLHNIPLVIKVTQRKRQDTGDMTNEIKGYKPDRAVAPTEKPEVAPWGRNS